MRVGKIAQQNIDMMCALLKHMDNEHLMDEIIKALTDDEMNEVLRRIVDKYELGVVNS